MEEYRGVRCTAQLMARRSLGQQKRWFFLSMTTDMLKAIARTVASAGWPIHTYLSGEAFLRAYDPGQPAVSYSICACRM